MNGIISLFVLCLNNLLDNYHCHVIIMTMIVVKMQKDIVSIREVKVRQTNFDKERMRKMPLYNRLKEHRARMGLNQQQIGALVGASRQTISLIERGDYSPSVTLALKLAAVCNVKVEDIFCYEEDEDNEGK